MDLSTDLFLDHLGVEENKGLLNQLKVQLEINQMDITCCHR